MIKELKPEKINGYKLRFYKQEKSNNVKTHAFKNGKTTHAYESKNKLTAIAKFKSNKPYRREDYGE